VTATPFLVPHRDEFSETVGFTITGPDHSIVWLPDIDKWDKWGRRIEDVVRAADALWLDGTFYANGEIPGRDMALIPHPFIQESIERLSALPASERAKIRFVHFNHTNPALSPESEAARAIEAAGFKIAHRGETFAL
jgi:pyrroloquinoline quinone biosynthesis protein B